MTKTEGIFTFPISMTPPQYSILGPTFGSKAEHCPIKTNTAENLRFFDKKKTKNSLIHREDGCHY